MLDYDHVSDVRGDGAGDKTYSCFRQISSNKQFYRQGASCIGAETAESDIEAGKERSSIVGSSSSQDWSSDDCPTET